MAASPSASLTPPSRPALAENHVSLSKCNLRIIFMDRHPITGNEEFIRARVIPDIDPTMTCGELSVQLFEFLNSTYTDGRFKDAHPARGWRLFLPTARYQDLLYKTGVDQFEKVRGVEGGRDNIVNHKDLKFPRYMDNHIPLSKYLIRPKAALIYKPLLRPLRVEMFGQVKRIKIMDSWTIYEIAHEVGVTQGVDNPSHYSLKDHDDPDDPEAGWLRSDKTLYELGIDLNSQMNDDGTFDEPTPLIYKRKLYSDEDKVSDLRNDHVLYLSYAQLRESVVSGHFPVSETTAALLAALQLQIEFGDHTDDHRRGFLDSEGLARVLPRALSKKKSVEIDMYNRHAQFVGTTRQDAERRYIKTCRTSPNYGWAFWEGAEMLMFGGRKSKVVKRTLGVGINGIKVLDSASKEPTKEFGWADLRNYEISRNGVELHFSGGRDVIFRPRDTTAAEQIFCYINDYLDMIHTVVQEEDKTDVVVSLWNWDDVRPNIATVGMAKSKSKKKKKLKRKGPLGDDSGDDDSLPSPGGLRNTPPKPLPEAKAELEKATAVFLERVTAAEYILPTPTPFAKGDGSDGGDGGMFPTQEEREDDQLEREAAAREDVAVISGAICVAVVNIIRAAAVEDASVAQPGVIIAATNALQQYTALLKGAVSDAAGAAATREKAKNIQYAYRDVVLGVGAILEQTTALSLKLENGDADDADVDSLLLLAGQLGDAIGSMTGSVGVNGSSASDAAPELAASSAKIVDASLAVAQTAQSGTVRGVVSSDAATAKARLKSLPQIARQINAQVNLAKKTVGLEGVEEAIQLNVGELSAMVLTTIEPIPASGNEDLCELAGQLATALSSLSKTVGESKPKSSNVVAAIKAKAAELEILLGVVADGVEDPANLGESTRIVLAGASELGRLAQLHANEMSECGSHDSLLEAAKALSVALAQLKDGSEAVIAAAGVGGGAGSGDSGSNNVSRSGSGLEGSTEEESPREPPGGGVMGKLQLTALIDADEARSDLLIAAQNVADAIAAVTLEASNIHSIRVLAALSAEAAELFMEEYDGVAGGAGLGALSDVRAVSKALSSAHSVITAGRVYTVCPNSLARQSEVLTAAGSFLRRAVSAVGVHPASDELMALLVELEKARDEAASSCWPLEVAAALSDISVARGALGNKTAVHSTAVQSDDDEATSDLIDSVLVALEATLIASRKAVARAKNGDRVHIAQASKDLATEASRAVLGAAAVDAALGSAFGGPSLVESSYGLLGDSSELLRRCITVVKRPNDSVQRRALADCSASLEAAVHHVRDSLPGIGDCESGAATIRTAIANQTTLVPADLLNIANTLSAALSTLVDSAALGADDDDEPDSGGEAARLAAAVERLSPEESFVYGLKSACRRLESALSKLDGAAHARSPPQLQAVARTVRALVLAIIESTDAATAAGPLADSRTAVLGHVRALALAAANALESAAGIAAGDAPGDHEDNDGDAGGSGAGSDSVGASSPLSGSLTGSPGGRSGAPGTPIGRLLLPNFEAKLLALDQSFAAEASGDAGDDTDTHAPVTLASAVASAHKAADVLVATVEGALASVESAELAELEAAILGTASVATQLERGELPVGHTHDTEWQGSLAAAAVDLEEAVVAVARAVETNAAEVGPAAHRVQLMVRKLAGATWDTAEGARAVLSAAAAGGSLETSTASMLSVGSVASVGGGEDDGARISARIDAKTSEVSAAARRAASLIPAQANDESARDYKVALKATSRCLIDLIKEVDECAKRADDHSVQHALRREFKAFAKLVKALKAESDSYLEEPSQAGRSSLAGRYGDIVSACTHLATFAHDIRGSGDDVPTADDVASDILTTAAAAATEASSVLGAVKLVLGDATLLAGHEALAESVKSLRRAVGLVETAAANALPGRKECAWSVEQIDKVGTKLSAAAISLSAGKLKAPIGSAEVHQAKLAHSLSVVASAVAALAAAATSGEMAGRDLGPAAKQLARAAIATGESVKATAAGLETSSGLRLVRVTQAATECLSELVLSAGEAGGSPAAALEVGNRKSAADGCLADIRAVLSAEHVVSLDAKTAAASIATALEALSESTDNNAGGDGGGDDGADGEGDGDATASGGNTEAQSVATAAASALRQLKRLSSAIGKLEAAAVSSADASVAICAVADAFPKLVRRVRKFAGVTAGSDTATAAAAAMEQLGNALISVLEAAGAADEESRAIDVDGNLQQAVADSLGAVRAVLEAGQSGGQQSVGTALAQIEGCSASLSTLEFMVAASQLDRNDGEHFGPHQLAIRLAGQTLADAVNAFSAADEETAGDAALAVAAAAAELTAAVDAAVTGPLDVDDDQVELIETARFCVQAAGRAVRETTVLSEPVSEEALAEVLGAVESIGYAVEDAGHAVERRHASLLAVLESINTVKSKLKAAAGGGSNSGGGAGGADSADDAVAGLTDAVKDVLHACHRLHFVTYRNPKVVVSAAEAVVQPAHTAVSNYAVLVGSLAEAKAKALSLVLDRMLKCVSDLVMAVMQVGEEVLEDSVQQHGARLQSQDCAKAVSQQITLVLANLRSLQDTAADLTPKRELRAAANAVSELWDDVETLHTRRVGRELIYASFVEILAKGMSDVVKVTHTALNKLIVAVRDVESEEATEDAAVSARFIAAATEDLYATATAFIDGDADETTLAQSARELVILLSKVPLVGENEALGHAVRVAAESAHSIQKAAKSMALVQRDATNTTPSRLEFEDDDELDSAFDALPTVTDDMRSELEARAEMVRLEREIAYMRAHIARDRRRKV